MTGQLPAIADPTKITARLRAAHPVPALIAVSGERASLRFLEFFAANIRNPHTRRAYGYAVWSFWPGATIRACHRSSPFSRFTSPPGSNCSSRGAQRRPSRRGSPLSATCSTGW